MDGLEQVKAYARLNGDDFKAGDLVDVKQLGRCEVLETMPGNMLKLRTAERCPVIVKAIVCRRVQ